MTLARMLADSTSLTLSSARRNERSKNSLLFASIQPAQVFFPCSSPFMKDFNHFIPCVLCRSFWYKPNKKPYIYHLQVLSRWFPSLINLKLSRNLPISPSNCRRRKIQNNSTRLYIIGHDDPVKKTPRRTIPHHRPGTWNCGMQRSKLCFV